MVSNRTNSMGKAVVLGAAALLAATCSNASAPPSGGPSTSPAPAAATAVVPAVSINAVMVALVDHAAHNLWNAEREGMAPISEADWESVAEHAIQLTAGALVITAGGTGPTDAVWVQSPEWRAHARKMSEAGVAALAAAQSQNFERLVQANGQLVESCEGCHKDFKPSMPTEGILHGHAHTAEAGRANRPPG